RQFQAELDFAGVAGAGDGAEAGVGTGGLAGAATGFESGVDAIELGVVPGVEKFGAELQDGILVGEPAGMAPEPRHVEILEEGKIPVVDTRTAYDVAGGIAEGSEGRLDEGGGVEIFVDAAVAAGKVGIADLVGTLAFVHAGAVAGAGDI